MEKMYVKTAEDEHVEMYLKAMCIIEEEGLPLKVSAIAEKLNIRQPSVIEMLRKLNEKKIITYNKFGIVINDIGRRIGQNTIRKSRLLETMMTNILKIEINQEIVCGMEHHMNDEFTDALSTLLDNPTKSPSGKDIPPKI
ncbi:transcriptional regulator [Nitrosopumilus sp. b1]|uniref:metal-dependent transcriptional regulator n=1 Tax=Nitrosopumilus sp. b1 TaxID=2109907 RepID=UPI0015F52995|nr:metal-dependent transcriptional regulator [Nitrosopumilus sp. b1]KAF6242436.1 transcriptional regulator [Nitrosopumilus sp. b1]